MTYNEKECHQILESFVDALREYAADRKEHVEKALETNVLSALPLEKYGYGLIKATRILNINDNNRLY